MASGAISQREYSALCEEILNELGTLEIKAGQSVEQERENLKQVMSSG